MDNDGRLIGGLFENLSEPDWASDFLKGICVATRSHAAAVLSVDIPNRRHTLPAYVGQGRAAAVAFERTHAAGNPWRPADERDGHPAGSVVVPDDVLPLSSLRRTAFWSDFLRPMDVDHGAGVIGLRTPERTLSLTLLRSARVGVYGTQERAWLGQMAPHWVNACRLRDRLSMPDRESWEAARALDLMQTAVFFLGAKGQCRHWNVAGEALLQDGSLVRLRGGFLIAACPGAGTAVLGAGGPVALRRRNGKVAGHAAAHALPGHGVLGTTRAVVFIDLVGKGRSMELQEALREAYRLTAREAEIAARLAEGADLPAVARNMEITGAAARTRLKTVFGKLGVTSQGELVTVTASLRLALKSHVSADLSSSEL